MMTEDEHFLLCLAEEGDEVGQRVSKALRFGMYEVQAGQPLNNADRIVEEVKDLIAVASILEKRGQISAFLPTAEEVTAKEDKIRKYMAIARQQGTLVPA